MNSKWIVERISFDGDCIYNTEEECYYTYDKKDLEMVCEILNNLENDVKELQDSNKSLEAENLAQSDLIRQLKIALMTDDHQNFLKYRKKFVDACEEIAEDGKIINDLERENERLRNKLSKYKEIYDER